MGSTDNANGKSEPVCPHYGRDTCMIHFKCCPGEDWYPCHKCHNEAIALHLKGQEHDESPEHSARSAAMHVEATALDGTLFKCTNCSNSQKPSKKCQSCTKEFASYFCPECNLLIQKGVDPYHCRKCGVCRANAADSFHCDTCNVCMSLSLKKKHKCFADRGHDPCAICLEEVFHGAIIFPCFHMVHKECAEKLVLSGRRTCPMCRGDICSDNNADLEVSENMPPQDVCSRMKRALSKLTLTKAKTFCVGRFNDAQAWLNNLTTG